MLGKYLKRKFGKEEEIPPSEQFYTPLRIGLHSTLKVETVDMLGMITHISSLFNLPNGTLDVVGINTITNDDGFIYRVDATDHNEQPYVIQIVTQTDPRSGNEDIMEMMLFNIVHEHEPLSDDGWNKVREAMTAKTFTLNDLEYDRVWGEEEDGSIDPFVFEEKGVAIDGEKTYTNHQMLFGRSIEKLGEETTEFVLTGVEESEDSDTVITLIGFTLPPQSLKVQ